MIGKVRNATHLKKLVAGCEVRASWHAGVNRYHVRITTREAEWLRRQTEANGMTLAFNTRDSGTPGAGKLDLSVVEHVAL